MRPSLHVAAALLLAACSDPTPKSGPVGAATQPSPQAQGPAPLALEHDFGVLPHGEQRVHEFELDLDALGEPFVPMRVHLECSCGRADVRLRRPDGGERFVDGSGSTANLPTKDERVILHIELDTRKKEAVDLPKTESRGYVLLQPVTDTTGMARIRWPFLLRFGIDAPVELRPFAALDFGRIPVSQDGEVVTTVRGDDQHPQLTFGEVRSTDPNLQVTLEPREGHTLVRALCRPVEPGNHRAIVTIDTSLPGYQVALQATWLVVPDLEATPLDKVSISARIDQPQAEGAEQQQFVIVTDHDTSRSPEFVVHEIVAADGSDASSHFAVSLTALHGEARQSRMLVRYLGGLQGLFRGKVVLTKPGSTGPFLPIELVVFPTKQP